MSKQHPDILNLKYGEIILTCGNTSRPIRRRINVSDGTYIVNVNCKMPDDILTRPQTIERALWEFDLNAFPTLRHIQTKTDRILPLLKDGIKKNPERINMLRQRSHEETVMKKKWNDDQRAMFASQIAEQTKDAKVEFAKKHGYEMEMAKLIDLKQLERQQSWAIRNKESLRTIEKIRMEIEKLRGEIRDSLRSKGYEGPSASPRRIKKSSWRKKKKTRRRRRKSKEKNQKKEIVIFFFTPNFTLITSYFYLLTLISSSLKNHASYYHIFRVLFLY